MAIVDLFESVRDNGVELHRSGGQPAACVLFSPIYGSIRLTRGGAKATGGKRASPSWNTDKLTGRTYTPILRWKRGEKICLRELPAANKSKIWPCLALRDPTGRSYLGDPDQFIAELDKELGDTPCYVNLPLLDTGYSSAQLIADLKAMMSLSTRRDGTVPVCELPAAAVLNALVKSSIDSPETLALRIRPGFGLSAGNADGVAALASTLTKKGTKAVHLLVDRESNGQHDSKDLKAAIIRLLTHNAIARVALVAGTMPSTIEIGSHEFDRPEYLAYLMLKQDAAMADLCFGDYGVLSPDWREPTGGGGAAPTVYRYTTDDRWLVIKDQGGQGPTVAKFITLNAAYRGPDYSPGDQAIYTRSNWKSGRGQGNAEVLLRDSTSQHIVFVTNQML